MSSSSVVWTAERSGEEHGHAPRSRLTLCGLRVNEQFWKPGLPRCAICRAVAKAEEATPIARR